MVKGNSKFTKQLMVRITGKLEKQLRAEATRRGLSIATLVRDILEQALSEEAASLAAREGRGALEEAIKKAMKPGIDRLAKLINKAGHAAATSMYLNVQALDDLGKHDAVDLYQKARKKATDYLRLPEDELKGEEDK